MRNQLCSRPSHLSTLQLSEGVSLPPGPSINLLFDSPPQSLPSPRALGSTRVGFEPQVKSVIMKYRVGSGCQAPIHRKPSGCGRFCHQRRLRRVTSAAQTPKVSSSLAKESVFPLRPYRTCTPTSVKMHPLLSQISELIQIVENVFMFHVGF